MATKPRTNYLAGVTQDQSGMVYVDIKSDDCGRVVNHALWGRLTCVSSDLGNGMHRVIFPRGTSLLDAKTVMYRFDELYGPGV